MTDTVSLQANWRNGTLYIWASRGNHEVVDPDELRGMVSEAWDSLLISGAADERLALRLPERATQSEAVTGSGENGTSGSTNGSGVSTVTMPAALVAADAPALAFTPAEAMEVLTARPRSSRFVVGDSFQYWSRAAGLVTELLARQRFVPAIHQSQENWRGYWRIVIGDTTTSERISSLISSMPPVCRSFGGTTGTIQASELVENFMWTTTDAVVRRCLEGDELIHATRESASGRTPETAWLHALVSDDPVIHADPLEARRIHGTVRDWISKLEPDRQRRLCRTCLRLHAPEPEPDDPDEWDELGADEEREPPVADDTPRPWKLTVHVQATGNPSQIIDASMLWRNLSAEPLILERPFVNAKEQVLADLEHAARHFEPLKACLEPDNGMQCEISLDEAYRFLRDVAPLLKVEGFGIWLPTWWRKDRPRLQLQLHIGPSGESADVPQSALGLDSIVSYDWRISVGDAELSTDEIRQLSSARASLIKLRGQWTEVQPEDIDAALKFADSHRSGRMTILESLRHCYLTEHADTGLPIAGINAHGWVRQLLESSTQCEKVDLFEAPPGFDGTLRPYQLTGVRWLSFLTRHGLGACLADDMGLGKTIQLIALWLHERRDGQTPGPTLLIVPMSLVGNWKREIERFAPQLNVMVHHGIERLSGKPFAEEVARHDVIVSTYGLAHRDFEHISPIDWYRIALDEAQNIKNPAAKQSKAVRSLRSVHRLALTGTPVENRLSELWGIMEFLNPGFLGSARDFRRRFAVSIERERDSQRAAQLRKLIQPFVLRRRKSDPKIVGDLPAKLEMKVYCNLTREQAILYERTVGEMIGQIDHAGGIQRRGLILATLTKLKQICNHPEHFQKSHGDLPHRSGKCDRLSEMLDEVLAEGDQALVFTQFREMGHLLKRHLMDQLGVEPFFLHGGTPQRERDRMVQAFQHDEHAPPIFLLSLKAGGFGLNLTRANHVFHFDRWWNPAVEDQATDRVHRIGQRKQVQVHRFVCVGTLEERIDQVIQQKRALAEQIVGTGEDWLTELSTDALREIFALSRDAVAED